MIALFFLIMKIIQAYQYQENEIQFNATAYGNVSIYEYMKVVTLDNDTNVFVFNSSDLIKPNCLDKYCLILKIKWSGDAVVNLEYNGTMPYSVNDQVTDFMHIVDKNGSRIIIGFNANSGYYDGLYVALPDIKVYYRSAYPIKELPPAPAGSLPIFEWTLKFTYVPGKSIIHNHTLQTIVQNTGLGSIDLNYISGIQIRNAIICGIDAIALFFALYLIRKKSPKEMKVYRWLLLNISVWAFIADFNLTILLVPLSLAPAPGICALGISRWIPWTYNVEPSWLGIPYYLWTSHIGLLIPSAILVISLTGCGSAIIVTIYYRYRVLTNESTQLSFSKWWLLWTILFSLLSSFPIMLTEQLATSGTSSLGRYFESKYKYGFEIIQWLRCGIIDLENIFTKIFFFTVVFTFIFYTSIGIGLPIFMLYRWRKIIKARNVNNKKKWEKFQQNQQQLIISLLLQSTIPILTIVCPYITMVIAIKFEISYVIDLMSWLLEFSALHSTLNTLVMIIAIKPYREATLKLLRIKRLNVIHVAALHNT